MSEVYDRKNDVLMFSKKKQDIIPFTYFDSLV